VPPAVMEELRSEALRLAHPTSRAGLAIIVMLWLIATVLLVQFLMRR